MKVKMSVITGLLENECSTWRAFAIERWLACLLHNA